MCAQAASADAAVVVGQHQRGLDLVGEGQGLLVADEALRRGVRIARSEWRARGRRSGRREELRAVQHVCESARESRSPAGGLYHSGFSIFTRCHCNFRKFPRLRRPHKFPKRFPEILARAKRPGFDKTVTACSLNFPCSL